MEIIQLHRLQLLATDTTTHNYGTIWPWLHSNDGLRLITSQYIVTYTRCVVVWPITLRGFGLDTGFIHYGDYNYTDNNYNEHLALIAPWIPLTELYCTDVSLQELITSDSGDWLTHCCVLPSPYNIRLSQWKHSTMVARQPFNATIPSGERIHVTIRPRLLGNHAMRQCRWWVYPWNCNFRLPSNDGIRPNTSHYKRKSKVPSIEPLGTPCLTFCQSKIPR
jgi:hypothetical protein